MTRDERRENMRSMKGFVWNTKRVELLIKSLES